MQKNGRKLKVASLLVVGGSMLIGGGCLNSLFKNIWAGFGIGLGQIPAQIVYDRFLADALGGIIGDGNTNDNAG